MSDQELVSLLMEVPQYRAVPLYERLRLFKFIKEYRFSPTDIHDLFLQPIHQDWYFPHDVR